MESIECALFGNERSHGRGQTFDILKSVENRMSDPIFSANNHSRTVDEQMCDDYDSAGPYINTSIGILPNPYQGCKGS